MRDKLYFSSVCHRDEWLPEINDAKLIAIPKKWWSIKHWKRVNSFLKTIDGFVRKE